MNITIRLKIYYKTGVFEGWQYEIGWTTGVWVSGPFKTKRQAFNDAIRTVREHCEFELSEKGKGKKREVA